MTTVNPLNSLMKVTYPNGAVAWAPVFPDGDYYGKADVERGVAVAEVSYDCPLDRYHEWLCHVPSEVLERTEETFAELIRSLGVEKARRTVEILSTSEVYTHFRRYWEDR